MVRGGVLEIFDCPLKLLDYQTGMTIMQPYDLEVAFVARRAKDCRSPCVCDHKRFGSITRMTQGRKASGRLSPINSAAMHRSEVVKAFERQEVGGGCMQTAAESLLLETSSEPRNGQHLVEWRSGGLAKLTSLYPRYRVSPLTLVFRENEVTRALKFQEYAEKGCIS